MRINHNIASLNTYRMLNTNSTNANKALEKLSSGLQINRAGDDAAGLAISEKMRAQIRGLDRAAANAQDGISMIQTAEGGLSEEHSILQRMRELANQAANDTNINVDRTEIQKELTALTSEINRIGNTTEFNTQKLLDGGAAASGVSLSSTEAAGVAAKGGIITGLAQTDFTQVAAMVDATQTLQITVEDAAGTDATFDLDGAAFKTLWNLTDAGKAGVTATDAMKQEALVSVLNQMSSAENTIKLTADAASGRAVSFAELVDVSISPEGKLSLTSKIGGGDITIVNANTTQEFTDLFGVTDGAALAADVAGVGTDQTEAILYGSEKIAATDLLNLDDWVGKTFTVEYNGKTANITLATDAAVLEGDAATRNAGSVKVSSIVTAFNNALDTAFGAGAVTASVAENPNNVNDTNKYFQFETDSTVVTTDVPGGVAPEFSIQGFGLDQILGEFVPGSAGSGGKFSASFQIGANQGQSMTIEIEDMRSLALNISGTTSSANHTDVEGAKFTASQNVTDGTTNNAVEYSLDVSTHDSATAAIKVINNAIEKVSAQRSQLGAYQNRLEHTINNLGTSSENLTAAESRIRDVDMAKEMMEFTKNNILSQAAQSMLAQANQQPQGVLQLLR